MSYRPTTPIPAHRTYPTNRNTTTTSLLFFYQMAKQPLNKTSSTDSDPLTREDIHVRARELALIDGRTPPNVSQADYEQAKRELTGESELDRQEAMLDAIPEDKRNDPTPDSTGQQAPESPSEEEDDEGRSESEQLAETGVENAEREQVLQAAIEAAQKNKRDR